MPKINKVNLDGSEYDIERGMLPEIVQELPQTGSEDTMYLVPSENPGTQSETASGEFFAIQNDLPYESPLASVEMLGNATQSGTPTPDSPVPVQVVTGENVVKIEGKNLFNKDMTPVSSWHLTKETTQSGLKLTSTASGGVCYTYYEFPFKHSEPVDVTISFQKTGTGFVNIYFRDENGNAVKSASNQTSTFTILSIPSTAVLAQIYFYGDTSAIGKVTTYDSIQLELGSTATDYEPYQGQEFEVNLGKNLISNEMYRGGYYYGTGTGTTIYYDPSAGTDYVTWTPNADGTTTIDAAAAWRGGYMMSDQLKAGETYYLSVDGVTTTGNQGASVYTLDSTHTIVRNILNQTTAPITTQLNQAITLASNECYIAVSFGVRTTTGTVTVGKVQLELGSSATSWAEHFTPIELAKIGNYQDKIYKQGDDWFVHKEIGKVVLDSTKTWIALTPTASYYEYQGSMIFNPSAVSGYSFPLSDHFAGSTNNRVVAYSSTAYVRVPTPSSLSTVDAFKSWLASNPTTVYYALATPTTTEITEQSLIAQLDALESASLYVGVNYIGTGTLNAVPTLVLGYSVIDPQKKYDEYVWVEDGQEYELVGQAGAIQQLQRDVAEIKDGSSVTHLIPIIEDDAVWNGWQNAKDQSYAAWELLSCDKVSFSVSGTSETMSLQEVFTALENGAGYIFDSLPLNEVDPVILGSNPPEYPEISGVAVPSRQSFSYVAGPDPTTDTINVIFRSGSVESILIPYNDNPRVYKVMTGVLRQENTGGEYKYLFMLGRVISAAPIG